MRLSVGNGRVRLFKNAIAISMMGMVVAGSGLVGATEARAAIVTWTFDGTIQSFALNFPGITAGDAVSGTVLYDTNASGTNLGYGTEYILNSPPSILSVQVAGMTFSSAPGVSQMRALVSNDTFGGTLDSIIIADFNGVANSLFEVEIRDEVLPLDLLLDESLPTMLDFAKADPFPGGFGSTGRIQFGGIIDSTITAFALYKIDSFASTVTSGPVPEPGTLLLIGSGVVGIGALTRRRRQK